MTPSAAATSDTTIAAWKPSRSASGVRPLPALALFAAVTTASTSAPPNWNEVFSSPPASPCSWGAMPFVAAMLSGP